MPEIKRPLKVFLYHALGDRDAVRDLYLRLIKDGVDAWLVKERLLPGQDWRHEIHKAVREADVVVVCLSERFKQAEFRQKEVRVAFDTAIEQLEGESFIIPACLEECDQLENPEERQWVDLFEEAGYEMLMHALQVRADRIGATIQRKEGSLPQITTPSVKHEHPMPEDNPVEAVQGILEVLIEGPAILIEGPTVKLQESTPQRKLGRAMIVILIGLVGIIVAAVRGSPQLERSYQLSLTIWEETPIPEFSTGFLPEPVPKAAHSNIVFVIDTSSSMRGQKISIVKYAISDFVSHLSDRYLVSVIKFDTNVELQIGLTRNHTDAGKAIKSIIIDVADNGSCIHDALYAAIQETSLTPIAKDTRNIIILLTDINRDEYSLEGNCDIPAFKSEVLDVVIRSHVSTFTIHIGEDVNANPLRALTARIGGTSIPAVNDKDDIARTLLSISEGTALELNTERTTPAPLPAETTGVRHAPMVFVPPGEFVMGNNKVYLDAFWIDKTEVTNSMYAKCVQAGTCSAPGSNRSRTRDSYYGSTVFDNYPVIFVSWMDANDYCAWAGGRLPTEAEWEKAARGTDGRQFPWGDDDPWGIDGLLNYQAQDTTEVGTYPNGASPYGALDMAGNVAEWVADWLSLEYYSNPPASNPLGPDSGQYRVWRGGSWANTSPDWIHTYSRTGNLPTDDGAGLGFRCARDAAP